MAEVQGFVSILNSYSNLTEIVFQNTFTSPWTILQACLTHPSILAITIDPASVFAFHEAPSAEEIMRVSAKLTSFAYRMITWREQLHRRWRESRPEELFVREAKWLAVLVPHLASTVKHLYLPMETAPLQLMTTKSWPELRTLSIHGRYLDGAETDSLPAFIGTLPRLEELSILACRRMPLVRPPILGRVASPSNVLVGLRSLTVAYPDPNDDIFSVDTSRLHRLSLRDWPRYYHDNSLNRALGSGWGRPILTSSECVAILKRMDMPDLSSLELVYLASAAGSDDELLTYVAHTYPRLTHLELHRYRSNREEVVDHVSSVRDHGCHIPLANTRTDTYRKLARESTLAPHYAPQS